MRRVIFPAHAQGKSASSEGLRRIVIHHTRSYLFMSLDMASEDCLGHLKSHQQHLRYCLVWRL